MLHFVFYIHPGATPTGETPSTTWVHVKHDAQLSESTSCALYMMMTILPQLTWSIQWGSALRLLTFCLHEHAQVK